ncbi:MAG: hypothetical protein HGA75_17695 [Thiobacillus sp.]|nr:hypothetical protein [Thiobacillus sp.]
MLAEQDPDASREFAQAADAFAAAVDRSLAGCAQRLGRPAMPASPHRRLDAGAIGSLAFGYPVQLCAPDDPRLLVSAAGVLVVSEESGDISLAFKGNLRKLHGRDELRERLEDIPWLAQRFLAACAHHNCCVGKRLSPAAERLLLHYPWPGNVRELKHLLERACLLTDNPVLAPDDLFDYPPMLPAAGRPAPWQPNAKLGDYLNECERAYIRQTLDEQGWHIQETAERLGISRKGLWEKMKKLGIQRAGVEAGPPD